MTVQGLTGLGLECDLARVSDKGASSMCCSQMMDDDYMLYVYKVRPCDRKGAHSWTECPFTHPGEKAARRCPKTHIYSADACPDARKSGKCARGDACPYSHGVFEQWLHPSRYRTQLCSFGTACRRPVCFFAHTVQELRVPTACGPAPAAAGAAQQAAALAAAAASACQNPMMPGSMDLMLQQALLAQMQLPAQVDGATATLINRYQAASCAALANAAACQRQQQQHQAAAAAAAAAALAAAATNPAALMNMAQAAQAYQAAAAAAAAAAANVPFNSMGAGPLPAASTPFASAVSNSSGSSSPTCGSTSNSLAAFLNRQGSASTGSGPGMDASCSGDLSGAQLQLLQQALLSQGGNGCGGSSVMHGSAAGACSPLMPWLPAASGAPAAYMGGNSGNPGPAQLLAGGYPSGLMPATPAQSDSSLASGGTHASSFSCGLDALVPNFSRQLSLSVGLNS
jgi:hypothetical protein